MSCSTYYAISVAVASISLICGLDTNKCIYVVVASIHIRSEYAEMRKSRDMQMQSGINVRARELIENRLNGDTWCVCRWMDGRLNGEKAGGWNKDK